MIDLKTHNDLVQKLIKDNDRLQNELKEASTKLRKLESMKEVESLRDKEFGRKVKDDVGKTNKLQKQFKDKIDQMNKIVRDRDLEITELKERLQTKFNIDDKQKDHLLQTFKKWQGRKPNSSSDFKFMSVINHYQTQIDKLTKQIGTLKTQSTNYQQLTRTLKKQLIDKENQSLNFGDVEKQALAFQDQMDSRVSKLQSDKMARELSKKDKRIDNLEKQLAQLRSRYEDLTKEYYKMINQYGQLGKTQKTIEKPKVKPIKHSSYVENIPDTSLAYSLSVKNEDPQQQQTHELKYIPTIIDSNQMKRQQQIIIRLLEILELSDQEELVPSIIKLDVAMKSIGKMEACLKTIKDFFEKILDKKVNLVKIREPLDEIQKLIGEAVAHNSLLREMEIRLGTKREGLLNSLNKLREENKEYYDSLKNIAYIKQLELAKQIQQFMDFFKLNPSEELPLQIRQLYEQLKSLDSFTNMCNKLLQTNLSVPQCLQKVLGLVERMKMGSSEVDYDILTKLEKELHVQKFQLLAKVKQLLKKIR